MELDSGIIMMLVSGIITQALILYLVIVQAVRPNQRERQLNQQIALLIEIARMNGVPEERLKEIFNS
jgi:hypothetical protein